MAAQDHISQDERHETVVSDYLAGRLSPAKHAIIAAQRRVNGQVDQDLALKESVASAFMDEVAPQPLSPDFMDRVVNAISAGETPAQSVTNLPDSLKDILDLKFDDLSWNTLLPGISTYNILGDRKYGGDRLYLLKIRAGMGIWDHTHRGEEWALLLKGAYESDGVTHRLGDLHIENEMTMHSLRAGDDEDCICLVMTDGPIIMKSWFGKLLTKFIGL